MFMPGVCTMLWDGESRQWQDLGIYYSPLKLALCMACAKRTELCTLRWLAAWLEEYTWSGTPHCPHPIASTLHLFPYALPLLCYAQSFLLSSSSSSFYSLAPAPMQQQGTDSAPPLVYSTLFPHWIAWELRNGRKEWRERM